MKYLIITNHSYMLWQFRKELLEALLKRGEVVISTPFVGHEEDLKRLGCRCVETKLNRRGMNPLDEFRLVNVYSNIVRDEKPDLVITYSIKPNLYAGLVCRRLGIPYAVNVTGLGTAFQRKGVAQVVTALYRQALKKARVVFFENHENADFFVRKGIVPKEQIHVLAGAGVNCESFSLQPYPKEEKEIRFLHLGRIMREKGMDEFFYAARRLKERYGERVSFDLVGFFEDSYEEIVHELVKQGVIRFHGFQEDPRPFYAAAHCVVLPSYHEGMSNVLLEAAATGRPLIASDIPGCREAVDDGKTGFLVAAQNGEALYMAMNKFVEGTAEQHEEMGKRGREKMLAEFDKKNVVQDTISALM